MASLKRKKQKNVVIIIVMIVVLGAALIAVKVLNKDEDDGLEKFSMKLTSLESGKFKSIVYEYDDGTKNSYKYVDEKWFNADDLDFPMSTDGFENQFIEVLTGLETTRKITEFEGGIESFGLDKPVLTVTVTSTSDVVTTYKVGNYNQSIDEYYLMIDDDEKNIYTVSDDLEYICRKDIYDYASVDTFPTYSLATLKCLQFESDGNTTELAYDEDGKEEDITGYKWKWFFGKPFSRYMPCESSRIDTLEETLEGMEYTKTVNYKATEEELKEYGLDKPQGSYSIFFTGEEDDGTEYDGAVIVQFGKSTTDGGYYTREIRRKGLNNNVSNVVRIASASTAETVLGINPLESLYSNIFFLEIDDIEGKGITFVSKNNKKTFSYDSGEDSSQKDDVYTMEGTEIDADGFKNLWYEMVSLESERVLIDKTQIKTAKPVYSILAERNKDDYYGDITINFIDYDVNYYQIEINGATDFLMRKRNVDKFFDNVDEFIESEKSAG